MDETTERTAVTTLTVDATISLAHADLRPWEKALQQLHEQAHPEGTIYASQCREPGCIEFYNPTIT